MLGNWHVRFGGEGSETWHSNVLRRTALTLLWNAGFLKVLMGAKPPVLAAQFFSYCAYLPVKE